MWLSEMLSLFRPSFEVVKGGRIFTSFQVTGSYLLAAKDYS